MAMDAIGSVLAATDFSAAAERAARRAARLARELGARLELLHVSSGAASAPEAERALAEVAALLHPQLARVEVGSPAQVILEAAKGHDLLVLGNAPAASLREAFLGSTAERLLLRAERPMLVVKREPAAAYRRVLVPSEFAPPARRALELALRVAPGARITLLHASEEERSPEAEARTLAWLSGLGEGLAGAAAVEGAVRFAKPRQAIAEMVESLGADLVVMGKQGRSQAERVLGSVTRHVLSAIDCDGLVAPLS
jgi:nucleotide-binding universal stress UspA family protein